MDSLRYWVARDARRRLPLRPRVRAGPRAARRRPARRLLRHHPAGPRALAGEAHRRALGPGRGRLPGRQLPRPLGGVERHVPRHRPRASGTATSGQVGRARLPPHRLAATSTSRAAAGRTRASTSSPPTTASRCTTWSATTTSTTRPTARTTATAHDDNLVLELRRRGADRRRRDPGAARAAEAELPRHAAALAGRADAPRRRRDRAHPGGNNNAYCQDNEMSWLDWQLDARAARAARVHAPAHRAPQAPSRPPAPPVLPGSPDPRLRGEGPRLVPARRQGDDATRSGTSSRAAWVCVWPAMPWPTSMPTAGRSSTTRC